MSWITLIFAGLLEIMWTPCMKQSYSFTGVTFSLLTTLAMLGNFMPLSPAMKSVPLGTAYRIGTSIGALCTFLAGIFYIDDQVSFMRIAAVVIVVCGLIMRKLTPHG